MPSPSWLLAVLLPEQGLQLPRPESRGFGHLLVLRPFLQSPCFKLIQQKERLVLPHPVPARLRHCGHGPSPYRNQQYVPHLSQLVQAGTFTARGAKHLPCMLPASEVKDSGRAQATQLDKLQSIPPSQCWSRLPSLFRQL